MTIDLTPFGFTPTEATAYGRLLVLGPSSGYAVAKDARLARANAYVALDGLVTKGAALADGSGPKLYRPVTPDALLARISAFEARKLEKLEGEVAQFGRGGAPATFQFRGEREFGELGLRTAARHRGEVTFIGCATVLASLMPVWRKREADGAPTRLFTTDAVGPDAPIPVTGWVNEATVRRLFGGRLSLVLTPDAAVVSLEQGTEIIGSWTSDPLQLGLLRSTVELLTAEAPAA